MIVIACIYKINSYITGSYKLCIAYTFFFIILYSYKNCARAQNVRKPLMKNYLFRKRSLSLCLCVCVCCYFVQWLFSFGYLKYKYLYLIYILFCSSFMCLLIVINSKKMLFYNQTCVRDWCTVLWLIDVAMPAAIHCLLAKL